MSSYLQEAINLCFSERNRFKEGEREYVHWDNVARLLQGDKLANDVRASSPATEGAAIIDVTHPLEDTADDGEPPRSRLGRLLPCSRVRRGQVLIVLKSYFDKSGAEEAKFLTLSGIAANDKTWGEIDHTWDYMLNANAPKAAYMHMKEAVHLNGEFSPEKGWDDEKASGLVNWLLSYITQFQHGFKDAYCQFFCTIDMEAYRRLAAEGYQLDSPVDICNSTCVEGVMAWYVTHYKGGLDYEASYYFDMGEPFKPVFEAKWESEVGRDQATNTFSIWSHIKNVGTVSMRKTPGMQIADMLAWGINREKVPIDNSPIPPQYKHIALALTRLAPTFSKTWDESELRKRYRPLIYKSNEKY